MAVNLYVDTDLGTDDTSHGTSAGSGACKSLNYLINTSTKLPANLVTDGNSYVIHCKGSAADTTNVSISKTTDSSHYLTIQTDAADRFSGKWDTSKYRLDLTSAANGIDIVAPYTNLIGIPVRLTTNTSFLPVVNIGHSASVQMSYCYVEYVGSGVCPCLGLSGYYATGFRAWNSILVNRTTYSSTSASSAVIYMGDNSATAETLTFYNCTVIGTRWGINISPGSNKVVVCKNVLVQSTLDAFTIGSNAWTGSDYNAANSAAATGGAHDRVSQTFTFVNAGAGDYHLDAADAGARTYGVTDPGSGLFSDDIDGQTRSAPWDIGADQYVAAGGYDPSTLLSPGPIQFTESSGMVGRVYQCRA